MSIKLHDSTNSSWEVKRVASVLYYMLGHSRQLLKMLCRDSDWGRGHDVQECFATPTFIVTLYYVHSNDIENRPLHF